MSTETETDIDIEYAIISLYSNEMTEQGLDDLRARFPKDVVHDMTDDAQFKAARKIRTERNKLIEAIKARRIGVTGKIKTKADELTCEVELIYATIVGPFETQNKINKDAKEKAERELKVLLDGQRIEINDMNKFASDCIGKSSQSISEVIEAVDLIDTTFFHKEIIHEAIETKKTVCAKLGELLTQAINEEALQIERDKLTKQQQEADEKQKIAELKAKTQERLNKLIMIPMSLIGKSSSKIKAKIDSLNKYIIPEDEFGELYSKAVASVKKVIKQLTSMHDERIIIEDQIRDTEDTPAPQEVYSPSHSYHSPSISPTCDGLNDDTAAKQAIINENTPTTQAATNPIIETVTISKTEYQQLLSDSEFLGCLHNVGLSDWDGYDQAQSMMHDKV